MAAPGPRPRVVLALLALLAAPSPLALAAPARGAERWQPGPPGWHLDLRSGFATPLASHLEVRQERGTFTLDATWEGRPFEDAPYYAARIARWGPTAGWELELMHHKLYLERPIGIVDRLEISHGYNLLLFGRSWRNGRWVSRLGAGPVIAHPESTVDGRRSEESQTNLGGGYHLTGPAGRIGAAYELPIAPRLYLPFEAALTGAWAQVPVAGGEAEVPDVSFHFLVGVGLRPPGRAAAPP
jgi:hypothetical protein